MDHSSPRRWRASVGAAVAVLLALGACSPGGTGGDEPAPSIPVTPPATASPSPGPSVEPAPEPSFDREARSIDDPASIWVVVNKL
ncbi:MAG: M15 family metallopeptidase, partial [Microcella sp.]